MSPNPRPLPEAAGRETWPQGIAHRATMTIGQVLELVQPEFPQVTVSKLRFLENEGLLSPERTGSGYRKYSQADVVRLRFILAAQRDKYWPLRVIRERLDALDAGEDGNTIGLEAVTLPAQQHGSARLTMTDLAALAGTSESDVEQMVQAGLLRPDHGGRLTESDATLVRLVAGLAPWGIELRHLRPLVHAVEQELELIARATAVVRHRRDDHAREDASERAGEIAATLAAIHAALLRGGVLDQG